VGPAHHVQAALALLCEGGGGRRGGGTKGHVLEGDGGGAVDQSLGGGHPVHSLT